MKEKIAMILGNRFVQFIFGGGLLTLLADATNTFHAEVAGSGCDTSTIIGATLHALGLC